MGFNSRKARLGIAGLTAVVALSGCSNPQRTLSVTGAGMRTLGSVTGVVEAQTVGGGSWCRELFTSYRKCSKSES